MAGVAGLVAGAMSMAAGEYVSVSAQSDTERADIARERAELAAEPEPELQELTSIYASNGLTSDLAAQAAQQLMAHDALGARARDELGISEALAARSVQAALASPAAAIAPAVVVSSLLFLGALGAIGARTGGAPIGLAARRVLFWGAPAMALTAAVGKLFGAVV
jgi:VIT1/CCC1 family predicted Fe2+/Mn2+ transporter